jgi:hypothetical protein
MRSRSEFDNGGGGSGRPYDHLEREQRKPQTVRDHTAAWNKLSPIANLTGDARGDIVG